ncbi:MAG: FtsX-like permease family protein [Oscillospiraceae bacterium]|nr:FtsX-like permease family protein [Oscillospiraceae bacterium]
MVMKRNAMRRNLRQSILKSLGRYIAIVMIIALGASLFIGLLMTKSDMVATGQAFMDDRNMFDLRLMNSYGWTEEYLEEIAALDGVEQVDAVRYLDLIARVGDSQEDEVYRFITIPETLNLVSLRGGRMPQNKDECLVDGFHADDSILGQKVVIQSSNDEDSLEYVKRKTLTIVGYVATPLYMDMNRGTTSVGSGSLSSYFYVPAGVLDMDYIPEINVSIPGDYAIYSDVYNDALEEAADTLEPQLQKLADRRMTEARADAEEAWQDGMEEYQDGLDEYHEKKAEAKQELRDAYQELVDAEEQIADSEQLLIDGEEQLAEGKKTLSEAKITLEESKRTFAGAKAEAYQQINNSTMELFINYQSMTEERQTIDNQILGINTELMGLEAEILQVETQMIPLDTEIQQIESMIGILDTSIEATQSALDMLQSMDSLRVTLPGVGTVSLLAEEPEDPDTPGDAEPETPEQPEAPGDTDDAQRAELEARLAELKAQRTEYEAQLEAVRAEKQPLQQQMDELNSQKAELEAQKASLESQKALLDESTAQMAAGLLELAAAQIMMENQFAAAEAQIEAGEAQLEAGLAELELREQEIPEAWEELEKGKQELADGWKEYEEGRQEAEKEFYDAWRELTDAKAELADARIQIDEMTENDIIILDRNSNVGYNNLDSASDIVQGVSRVFPVFFILVASLVCITTMTRMIDEERTQIGTLKALGYSNRAIISKYMFYSGSGAVIGCVVGILIGSTIFPMILWEAYKIMLFITPGLVLTVNWPLCIAVLVVYTAALLLVTWYCCRKALQEVPAELIRPKAPDAGKALWVEKLPFWHRIGFLNKVMIRNIFRYRQRLAMMLVGIGGCTALLVTGFGLRDSIVNVVDFQFEDVTQYDLEVYFRDEVTEDIREEFLEIFEPGIETMFYHQTSMELEFDNRVKDIYMISAEDELSSFIDLHSNSDPVPLPGLHEVVLSVGVSEAMGINVGDRISMRNPDMEALELTVSGIYDNHVYNYSIVSPDTILEQWGERPQNQMAFVKLPEGMDVHATGAEISELKDVMNVSVSEDLAGMVRNMMDALDLVIIVIVFCAGLLAVTVLYNLTNININERIREIATIKVLGFNASETASYVFKENMALTVVGSGLGLGLGYLLLVFVMSQIKIDMVWFKTMVMPLSYVYAIVLTILAAVVVDFIFYFKLQKINMAEALKSVE